MPLFMCTKCGCVENTALSEYWQQEAARKCAVAAGDEPLPPEPRCSQCHCGEWHGQFPRKLAEGYLADARGRFIYTQEQASGSASHMGPFVAVKLPEGARV